jgi:hypothetical protein
MTPSVPRRPWRVLFVGGAMLALAFGTAGLARADTACASTDLSCTVASVAPTVPPAGDPVDQVQNGANDATKTVEDTVSTTKDAVDDVVNGLLGSDDPGGGGGGGGSGGGSGTGGGHGPGSNHHGGPTSGPRQPIAGPGSPLDTTGTAPGSGLPPVDRAVDPGSGGHPTLAQTVTGIALGVIAPLLVLLLCAFGFVMFQQRLDARDPHLADAPVVPDVAVFA